MRAEVADLFRRVGWPIANRGEGLVVRVVQSVKLSAGQPTDLHCESLTYTVELKVWKLSCKPCNMKSRMVSCPP